MKRMPTVSSGREMVVAKIVGRLANSRFLAVIGASGSGKSSVVRAGVIPALRKGERLKDRSLPPTDSGQWDIRTFTPRCPSDWTHWLPS